MENLHKLIDGLADKLFLSEARRLQARIDELDRQNGEIRRERAYGFQWKGHRFYANGSTTRVTRVPALDFALRGEGDNFLQDKHAVADDKQMIKQTMWLLLKDCMTIQDIRDSLPESLVDLSDDLKRLHRERPAAYNIRDARLSRQYQKMLDKIDFYAATRMMY